MAVARESPWEQQQQQQQSGIFRATLNTLFLDPFILLLSNPTLFLLIYLFLTLPLSFFLTSLSISSAPIQARIHFLESLSLSIETRIEALNILEEAHGESNALLRLRVVHALPCLVLSLLTLVAAVGVVVDSGKRKVRVWGVVEKVKDVWWRVVVTGVVAHAAAAGVGEMVRTGVGFGMGRGGVVVGLGVGVVGWVVEVYLAAVMGVGMVVAVVEERWGVDAMWVGCGMMKGRRVCGVVVVGVVTAAMSCVRWEMEGMELKFVAWRSGMVCLLGLVLVWGNVVVAIYYYECRKSSCFNGDDCFGFTSYLNGNDIIVDDDDANAV